jgi:hypothetical protein
VLRHVLHEYRHNTREFKTCCTEIVTKGHIRRTRSLGNAMCDKMCLGPENSKWLWRSSWMHAVSMCVAWSYGLYDLAVLALMVLYTSLNYWRCPNYGYRRYVDIMCVQLAGWWMSLRNLDGIEPFHSIAMTLGMLTCLTFMVSVKLHGQHVGYSTLLHSMVHLLGNMTTVAVCQGQLPAISDSRCFVYLREIGFIDNHRTIPVLVPSLKHNEFIE